MVAAFARGFIRGGGREKRNKLKTVAGLVNGKVLVVRISKGVKKEKKNAGSRTKREPTETTG